MNRLDGWRRATEIADFLANHSLLDSHEEFLSVESVGFPEIMKMVTNGHCVAASIYHRRPPNSLGDIFGKVREVMNLRSVSVDVRHSPETYMALSLKELPCFGIFSFGEWILVRNLSTPEDVAQKIKDFCLSDGRGPLRKFVEGLLEGDPPDAPLAFGRLGATVASMSHYVKKVGSLTGEGRAERLGKLRKEMGVKSKNLVARNWLQAKIMLIVLLEEVQAMRGGSNAMMVV
jgi:hypothetical protein